MQLLALLNPALQFKMQQAKAQQDLAMRGADREDLALQAQLQGQQFSQQQMRAQQAKAAREADAAGRNADTDRLREEDAYFRSQVQQGRQQAEQYGEGQEATFVTSMGGPNTVGGYIRSYGGDPRSSFSGMQRKSDSKPQGGRNMQLSGSGSGTPFGQQVGNGLQEEAARVRAVNMLPQQGGGPQRAQAAPSFTPGVGDRFTAPPSTSRRR